MPVCLFVSSKIDKVLDVLETIQEAIDLVSVPECKSISKYLYFQGYVCKIKCLCVFLELKPC